MYHFKSLVIDTEPVEYFSNTVKPVTNHLVVAGKKSCWWQKVVHQRVDFLVLSDYMNLLSNSVSYGHCTPTVLSDAHICVVIELQLIILFLDYNRFFQILKLIVDNRKTNAHYQLNVWLRYATFDACLGATCKLVGLVESHYYPSKHNVTRMSVVGLASGVDSGGPTLKQQWFNILSGGWSWAAIPSKHLTLPQCWPTVYNAGPPSTTLAQHYYYVVVQMLTAVKAYLESKLLLPCGSSVPRPTLNIFEPHAVWLYM